jgi:hypothetical protein
MRTLYDRWKQDQVVAFSANELLSDAQGTVVPIVARAGQLIEAAKPLLRELSESTISLIAAIPSGDIRNPPYPAPLAYDIRETIALAEADLAKMRRPDNSVNFSVLATNSLTLFRQDHLGLVDFLEWAGRASGRCAAPELGWHGPIWIRMAECLASSGQLGELDALLSTARSATARMDRRIRAANELFSRVNAACSFEDATEVIPPAWSRLCLGLLSSMFCWPLMVAGTAGVTIGVSLPVNAFLSTDGASKVWFRADHRRYRPKEATSDSPVARYGLNPGRLCWDRNWQMSFNTGLAAAKELWKGQNGRLVSDRQKNDKLTCSLVVDLTQACEIVDAVFQSCDDATGFELQGFSAEVYICQVALGLLLPEAATPVGVATGRIYKDEGLFRIGDVGGIDAKLNFANNTGRFSLVVLPDTEATKTRVASAVALMQEGKFVEVNHCATARSAADAMQTSGWRRAHFFRAPAVQRSFYAMLYRLFASANSSGDESAQQFDATEFLAIEDLGSSSHDRVSGLSANKLERLSQLSKILTSSWNSVKYAPTGMLTEAELGEWLAWVDHRARSGTEAGRGAGMGILCVRTSDGDKDMRLWASIFDILTVNPRLWTQFQWANLEQAAAVLAKVLNNFSVDPSISYSAPPDLLVVIDDAGLTQGATNTIFPEDFRGQFFDLLNPREASCPAHLYDALQSLDESRSAVLGSTRLIVLYPQREVMERTLTASTDSETPADCDAESQKDRELLERLSIFRYSFTSQSAAVVLNHGREAKLEWQQVKTLLDGWHREHKVFRHRGRYHIRRTLARRLRDGAFLRDPTAHLAAAKSLAPIIQPRKLFLASNRDRSMEPEELSEAVWHLRQAKSLAQPRQKSLWSELQVGLGALTFLRPDPDWDTVRELLRTGSSTYRQAYVLAKKLIAVEKAWCSGRPHSSRYALAINTIGRYGKASGDRVVQLTLLQEAKNLFEEARAAMNASGYGESPPQTAKLLSEYAFCLRANGAEDSPFVVDLTAAEQQIEEIVLPMLGNVYLKADEAPLSRDWFKGRWQDSNAPVTHCTKFARIACDFFGETWDEPWLALMAMSSPDDFATEQMAAVLTDWQRAYDAVEFGTRIRGMIVSDRVSNAVKRAALHLYQFLTHPSHPLDPGKGPARDIALQLVQELVLCESQSCFDFLMQLPARALISGVSRSDRASLTAQDSAAAFVGAMSIKDVLGCSALLSRWTPTSADLPEFLRFQSVLTNQFPSTVNPTGRAFSEAANKARQDAIWNVYRWLGLTEQSSWAIQGRRRAALLNWVRALISPNDWLFVAAYRPIDQEEMRAMALLLGDVSEADMRGAASNRKLNAANQRARGLLRTWQRSTLLQWERDAFARVAALLT